MKKLYLVDVSSMFFRAFYAIPPLTNGEGMPTNALYGFLSMTIKLLRDIKPDYLVFCFDRKDGSFRNELYSEYKANRSEMPEDLVPQVPYVRQLTQLMGIKDIDAKGFEADDVIGTLASLGVEKGLEVFIVSGDKDFAQMVDSKVSMLDTMKNVTYDEQGVIEKWGVKPEQFIDYLALVGDSSDNIPGVRGIGPKGAQKLLAEYKDLETIYKNIENIKGATKTKLETNEDMAYLSKELVTIATSIDLSVGLDDFKLMPVNKEELGGVLAKLEFNSFARKLLGDGADVSDSVGNSKANSKAKAKTAPEETSSASIEKIDLSKFKEVTWDIETLESKVTPYSEIWGLEFERGTFFVHGKNIISVEGDVKAIGEVLGKKFLDWKGFDLKKLWRSIDLQRPKTPKWDGQLAAYVCRAESITSFDAVYLKYFGQHVPDLAGAKEWYQCQLQLEQLLAEKLQTLNGEGVFKDLELPLVPVLFEMERYGVAIDSDLLKVQSDELTKLIEEVEKKVYKESGESFNLASTKQLGQVLFEKMKIPPMKKTKTGFSTSADVLEKLALEHPICSDIIKFREYSKLKSTYVDSLPQLVDPETHRIHTHLRQAATTTGRLSSANPNLQNIPIRTERGRRVRQAFVAPKGALMLSADYSQIELRILAHITEDPGLCSAFADDLDIHAATASEIFSVPLNEVTPELRRTAKAVNFGIAYGQGVFGLAETLDISREEAKSIIGSYFNRFQKVKEYMESTVESAKESSYVETIYGRRRYIDELKSKNGNIRAFGERAAINAPIQGSASDLMKLAMIEVYQSISVPMLLQIHDEILFECPEDQVEDQACQVKAILEGVATLKVPLKVNIAWGQSWEDAHA